MNCAMLDQLHLLCVSLGAFAKRHRGRVLSEVQATSLAAMQISEQFGNTVLADAYSRSNTSVDR